MACGGRGEEGAVGSGVERPMEIGRGGFCGVTGVIELEMKRRCLLGQWGGGDCGGR